MASWIESPQFRVELIEDEDDFSLLLQDILHVLLALPLISGHRALLLAPSSEMSRVFFLRVVVTLS